MGIRYDEVETITNKSDEDYLEFIAKSSDGITPLGLKLFQQSVESYVYSILGAQVNTRWSIVGSGAKSLQTQDVFRRLVRDTIAHDDITVSISNMRTAISKSKVVLDTAISPGLILVPSNMIIQTEMKPGYNNALTVATKAMKFGKNIDVNYTPPDRGETGVETDTIREETEKADSKVLPREEKLTRSVRKDNSLKYLAGITTVGTALAVSKFIV